MPWLRHISRFSFGSEASHALDGAGSALLPGSVWQNTSVACPAWVDDAVHVGIVHKWLSTGPDIMVHGILRVLS